MKLAEIAPAAETLKEVVYRIQDAGCRIKEKSVTQRREGAKDRHCAAGGDGIGSDGVTSRRGSGYHA